MTLYRDQLPDAFAYYEGQGLRLDGRGAWRTTACAFHGGSDSMRVHVRSGAFVCMAGCGARGGDVLAYQMAVAGQSFIEAARALGAWSGDGTPAPTRPRALSAHDALACIETELNVVTVVISDARRGLLLSDADWARFLDAAARINFLAEVAI
jgi:hypothetical protein